MRPVTLIKSAAIYAGLVLGALVLGQAHAASSGTPAIIAELRANGTTVTALGDYGDLQGWWIAPANGSPYTAYTTSQGNTVVGVLYDTDGTMVTGQQLSGSGIPSSTPAIPEQEASDDLTLPLASITSDGPTTEVSEIARLYEDTENAFGFVLGHGGPVVHVFADPRCPYCRTHLQALSPAIHDGMVRVHVIPVGILGSRSAVKAVAIAGSEHPERAWYGDRSLATNKVEGAGHVKANNALHARWRARGVPFTVYEKAGEVRVVYGVGDDPAQMWKEAGQ